MFKNDGWAQWQPDPETAFREHQSELQPYASMSREEILAAMLNAKGGQEWEFLREYLLDKCSEEELDCDRFQKLLMDCGGLECDELIYLCDQAGMATRLRSRRSPEPPWGSPPGLPEAPSA
jgi:hypothetical protein